MKSVFVVGAEGQLALSLKKIAPNLKFLSRKDLDLSQNHLIQSFFKKNKADTIINAAGYTQVDKAESESDLAFKINAEAAGELAKHCDRYLYVSTDYVFDGRGDRPYLESDPCNPIGVYGKSKRLGEEFSIKNNPKSIVLRTSWLHSPYRQNFLKTMLRLSGSQQSLRVVGDQIGRPTYALDLADVILRIVNAEKKLDPGIYHYANKGQCSWYEFAAEIFRAQKISVKLEAITTAEYPTPAKRPSYSVLDTAKIEKALGLKIPTWQNGVQRCLEALKAIS